LRPNKNKNFNGVENSKDEASNDSKSSLGRINEGKNAAKNKKKKNNKKSLFQQKIQVLKNRYNKPTLLQRVF
jgi:hypothetical protein